MKTRPAKLGDIPGILTLETVCFVHIGERFNRRQVAGLIRNPRAITLVATRGTGLVGWTCALVRSAGRGKVPAGRLYALAVHPAMRGRRVGQTLTRQALQGLQDRGVQRTYLEVRQRNLAAIRLYESMGFVRGQELKDYYGPGIDGIKMLRAQTSARIRSAKPRKLGPTAEPARESRAKGW